MRVNSEVLQNIVVPYSFANSDGTGVDDFIVGLNNVKAMANVPELGNAISFLTFPKGESPVCQLFSDLVLSIKLIILVYSLQEKW